MTLPSHQSNKSLAYQFAFFLLNKTKTIRDNFVTSGNENDVHPPSGPTKIIAFTQVSEDAVDEIIRNSLTKSGLLDPWSTFLINGSKDILLPSITQLVNWVMSLLFQQCCSYSSYQKGYSSSE